MAYYGALVSLKNTIRRLLGSSILPPSREILDSAWDEIISFQKVIHNNEEIMIKNSSNERVNSLKEQTREVACKLEDALESHILNQYESLGDHEQDLILDLEEVREEVNSFIETMKKMEKKMVEELSKPLPEEEDDVVPSKIDFGGKDSKMVGLDEDFSKLKDRLMSSEPSRREVISIVGMVGTGKTALAMKIFKDPSILSHFDPRVFVTIGTKYQFKNVMLSILIQLNYDIDEICMEENESLAEFIHRSLQGKRYLIVLDEVWHERNLKELESLLPKESNGSRALVTTRLETVAYGLGNDSGYAHYIRFLNNKESWDLLRTKVFGEGYSCPFQLEKFGKKIAENCEGLPLTIVTVANILSKGEKTLEYWKNVAENEDLVFTDAYDQMSERLILSYNYLPQYLKPCFLYMGIFPRGCDILVSKVFKLWRAEGFAEGVDNYAKKYLWRLYATSIIMAEQRCSNYGIKIYKVHSVYRYLCVKEARKENFLHVMNRYTTDIKNQRRLCTHNNVLFGIKEIRNLMESSSMARSLLCTGPYHQYEVPICSGLRLLRVLDALTIRFYKFPVEVLKLVMLRYLALTYNGKVPGSISKLWNLETLIVLRHLSIKKSSRDSSYLPLEIWNMKKLRHVQVMGGNLPDPCGAFLPNLLTLSDMSMNSCSKEILERTPNLHKLGIRIELSPNVVQPLCSFDHFSHLHHLESLKCAIVNPKPRSHVVAPITTFPSNLKKMTLSGLGYPWEYMRTIAKLPNLEVLKLQCYAFQGPVWETYKGEFLQLKCLVLEDVDLVQWRADDIYCFPFVWRLVIKYCYKLKEIPSSFGCSSKRLIMKLVDCPSLGASVEQLQQKYQFRYVFVRSSLDDED